MAAENVTLQLLSTSLKVIAVCNNLSPLPASVKMWRTGKTEGWPTIFFVIGLCGALGMVGYGILQNNTTLIMIQGLQVMMNIYYIFTYTALTSDKGEPMRYIFGAVMYLSGLYACFMAYESHETAKQLDLLGAASGGVFFLMNCSTIIDVISTIRKKSADFDMIMLIVGMMNSSLWMAYGFMLNDIYLYGPGLPFLITGSAKLVLKGLYGTKPESKKKKN